MHRKQKYFGFVFQQLAQKFISFYAQQITYHLMMNNLFTYSMFSVSLQPDKKIKNIFDYYYYCLCGFVCDSLSCKERSCVRDNILRMKERATK